jgi:hypothetical protein
VRRAFHRNGVPVLRVNARFHHEGNAMEKPKHRPSPDAKSNQGRPARKSSEIQPVKQDDDTVLETYEQSPERPGGDERNNVATPDGPMPDRERATPD